ncbi:hypothetical protein Thpro_020576 [Acidihalobacter prosperus]|uniref:Uncharacterized protein n=1 Tax=Acidihalobacter prosperus TaxID=160660 RepID=A0A1A6C8I5_9GAMM|nr:hypothetical protein Thpro_020576 [Acidihalobacter prosperus]
MGIQITGRPLPVPEQPGCAFRVASRTRGRPGPMGIFNPEGLAWLI